MRVDTEGRTPSPVGHVLTRDVLAVGVITVIYFVATRLSLSVVIYPEEFAVLWPPSGIFLAALLLMPRSRWPWIISALLIADLVAGRLAGTPGLLSLLHSSILVCEATLGAWVLQGWAGSRITFGTTRQVFGFLAFCVVLLTGSLALVASGGATLFQGTPFWHSWKGWWGSEALGLIIVTPFMVSWVQRLRDGIRSFRWVGFVEGLLFFGIAAAAHGIVFTGAPPSEESLFLLSNFLTLPFLIWAALRFGIPGTSTVFVILACCLIPRVSLFSAGADAEAVLFLQFYLASVAVAALFLAAAVSEWEREREPEVRARTEGVFSSGEDLLLRMGEMAKVGGWEFEVESGRGTWTPEVARIHDLNPGAMTNRDFGRNFYQGRFRELIDAAIEEAIELGRPYDLELELTTGQGRRKWVRAIGRPVEVGGKVVKLQGTFQDITEANEVRRALQESEENYRLLVDASPFPIGILQDGKVVYANAATLRQLGGTKMEDLLDHPIREFVHPEWWEATRDRIQSLMETREGLYTAENRYVGLDGGDVPVEVTAAPVMFGGRPAVQLIAINLTDVKRAEETLRESEARYRSIFQSSPLGIALVNQAGEIASANSAFCELLGYSESEILGLHPVALTHPDDREGTRSRVGQMLSGEIPGFSWEKRFLNRNQDPVWALVTTAVIRDEQGGVRFSLTMVEDIGVRKTIEEELKTSQAQLRALAARLERVREEERRGIARELHDVLGQALTGLRMDLRQLEVDPLTAEEMRLGLGGLVKVVDENTELVRNLSARLRSPILDVLGMVAAIEHQVELHRERSSIRYDLDLASEPLDLPQETRAAVFRIIQEALTNIHRHAEATVVWIRLRTAAEGLVTEVEDNGVGIPEGVFSRVSSLGLIGMRERAQAIGGELTVQRRREGGTLVRLVLPGINEVPYSHGPAPS